MSIEYQIIKIIVGSDNIYGDSYVVQANPVQTDSLGRKFITSQRLGRETDIFLFPYDEDIIKPIIRIARDEGIWHPNESDFEEEIIFDEDEERDITIYRHVSFWSDENDCSYNSKYQPELIKNISYKVNQLKEQFYNEGWYEYYGLREYVVSLAEENEVNNFWGWLFDDSSLNGYMIWNLPPEYAQCYNDFLDLFD